MTTATARSTTFPRSRNFLKPSTSPVLSSTCRRPGSDPVQSPGRRQLGAGRVS
jgi:hypothetical protein